MKFSDYLNEDLKPSDSRGTLLNYITNSFFKLASDPNATDRNLILLLGAAVMANNPDAKAQGMAKRIAQLALTKKDPSNAS